MLQSLKGKVFLFLLLLTASIAIFIACRRNLDRSFEQNYETRFFSLPANTKPEVKAVFSIIFRQNQQSHFVNSFVKRIGYPYWGKAWVFNNKGSNTAGRSQTDSANYVYIPFARENDSFVNSALIVKLAPADTVLRMLYNNQYASFGFDSTVTEEWTARVVFHIFTFFDNEVFGHNEFIIKDKRILNAYPSLDIQPNHRYRVRITTAPSTGRTASYYPLTFTTCYEVGDDGDEGQLVGVEPGG